MTILGCSALLLAAIGVYGLMAYSVQQRTRELGIRMPLGARADNLRNSIIFSGYAPGVGWSVVRNRESVRAHTLDGFSALGRQALGPAGVCSCARDTSAVAFMAVWFPALRATRIDPMIALRYE
jgi:putative ABC transport system permease protein